MFEEGGVRTFYKGFLPTILQIGPMTALQFGLYHSLKMATPPKYREMSAVKLSCGAVAGVTSKVIVLPFDLVKKRLQVQGFEAARGKFGRVRLYSGALHCVATVLTEEGPRAFYKGSIPALTKASLSVSVSFCTYEKVLKLLST
jgi:solute carrier family 25 thiamine pyrophosphate transporter 19